jgi:hypothetical protein
MITTSAATLSHLKGQGGAQEGSRQAPHPGVRAQKRGGPGAAPPQLQLLCSQDQSRHITHAHKRKRAAAAGARREGIGSIGCIGQALMHASASSSCGCALTLISTTPLCVSSTSSSILQWTAHLADVRRPQSLRHLPLHAISNFNINFPVLIYFKFNFIIEANSSPLTWQQTCAAPRASSSCRRACSHPT